MDNFNKQLKDNLAKDIAEFNSNPNYVDIRKLYKLNFDKIESYIKKFGHKSAIEDISNINSSLTRKVMDNMLLLKEINKAISTGQFKKDDIK